MDIFDWPDGVGIRSAQWSLDRPASLNSSLYSGATSVAATPWYGKWSVTVTLSAAVAEDNVRALRGLLADLDGQVNAVRVPATEGGQRGLPKATAAANAAAGDSVITFAGCLLKRGQLFTVNDELKMVKSVSGYEVTFKPPLRGAVTAGAAIEVGNPTALMRLNGSAAGWDVDSGQLYSGSLGFTEAF